MGLWQWMRGSVSIEITSADMNATLRRAMNHGIIFIRGSRIDELTMRAIVSRADYHRLVEILMPYGDEIKVLSQKGAHLQIKKMKRRPILMTGLTLMVGLSLWLPTRVLFIHVSGNQQIPERLILETAAKCGIYFGAQREEVRSERMKNALLEAMPQLQWAGVNTAGCVAVITVREREPESDTDPENSGVSSIIAVRDGIIESCTASKGSLLCKPGQSVILGQKLISGYTDCGISIRAEAAQGEIYALTEHKLSVKTPANCLIPQGKENSFTKYSLKIGKKRINFYKGSGILPTTCDRIYTEKYITLPGGFVLPIAIIVEEYIAYDYQDGIRETNDGLLTKFAEEYLLSQMVAGQILSASEIQQTGVHVYSLDGVYRCREMIGRVVKEEIIKPNEYDK